MPEIFQWAQEKPLPGEFLLKLKKNIDGGKVIVYPTSTVYGLGASIYSHSGIRAVNDIKSRPIGMPLSIMASISHLEELCQIPSIARSFLRSGDTRITAILPALESAPQALVHNGTLAVRFPCSKLTASLVDFIGPITSTSANLHGSPPPTTIDGTVSQLGNRIIMYIDSGTLDGLPTTLVDYTDKQPKIIRKGAASMQEVEKVNER